MHVLLIGGTGFIGPVVARELIERGHDVTVFHRGRAVAPVNVRAIIGDRRRLIEFSDPLRAAKADVVVDLVLSSGAQARDLMTVFRGATRRVVALSSGDVYRACGVLHGFESGPLEPLPLSESAPLRTTPQTYPAAQIETLRQVFGWLDDEYDKIPVEREVLGDCDLPGTVLRLPMVYGAGDFAHRLHPIVKRIADRRPAILFEEKIAAWRGPRGYVENVAAAVALAATSDRAAGRIYNVAEPESVSELGWATEIARIMEWSGEFVVLPSDRVPAHLRMPGNFDQHWVYDTTRIREELEYRERVPREEAIRRTIAWELANPPTTFNPHPFDYGAEDAAVDARLKPRATS
jgi:nucleoside-diphosphate-sugar epimerase